MTLKVLRLAALLVVAAVWPVVSQEEETECHDNDGYALIAYQREDEFTDFLVKTKSSPTQDIPCRFDQQPQDFTISELDKTHSDDDRVYRFVALKDDLLIVEREQGSAVITSYLLLINLDARESSDWLGVHYGLEEIGEAGVSFWETTDIQPTRKNCPNDYKYDGSAKYEHAQAFIHRKVKFDFASRKVIKSSITQCVVLAD